MAYTWPQINAVSDKGGWIIDVHAVQGKSKTIVIVAIVGKSEQEQLEIVEKVAQEGGKIVPLSQSEADSIAGKLADSFEANPDSDIILMTAERA